MQAAITDDPQKPWHAGWHVQLAYQVVLTLAAATVSLSDRAYATYVEPSDSVSSAAAAVLRPEDAGGLGHSRILSSLASYIDKGRYYWLDQVRYHYLDVGQYNLLGVETYFWRRYCYPIWYGFPQSGGPYRFTVNPFVDSFCPTWVHQSEPDDLHAWPTYRNPGDYIDRDWYCTLDQGQYCYLEQGQYDLLGGFAYVLGHPCSAMWYDYRPHLWGMILEKAISPPEKALPEWAKSYGDFTILGEPAQVGDLLQATATAGGAKSIHLETTFEIFNFQLPIFNCQWGAWDESAARWYPAEVTRGLAKWTAYGGCPTLKGVNAVPEPSTIAFLALGAWIIRRRNKWESRSRKR